MAALVYLPQWLGSSDSANAVESAEARLQSQASTVESLRQELHRQWLELESMRVSTWAAKRSQRAVDLLQEGERLAGNLDHLAALRALEESHELVTAMIEQAPQVAADRREAGWLAYRNGDAETAAEHFRIVLAIEPADEKVRDALERTAFLTQVVELQRRARRLTAEGDLAGAREALQEARRIDPQNPELSTALEEIDRRQADAGYQSAMSAVQRALGASDFPAARKALARAGSLRPGAAEVRDAGVRIDVAVRAARTASLRERAAAAEAGEDWESAIGYYGELLQLDPALVLAQQGRDRARRLASLTTRAQALLEEGDFSLSETRRRAANIIEQVESVSATAPSLRALGQQLEQAVILSKQPVKVVLESDNQTEVVVFRVGRLGRFDSHELELMPGRYTVIGTRSGFRDVRAELVIEPGIAPESLVVRCEEQI